H
ncbi:hypothetical protein ACTFIW_012048, partial [Dictyostelium discoideum]